MTSLANTLNKLEIIEWLDHAAYSLSEWRDMDEIYNLEPVTVQTVGFVVKETKTYIVVISTFTTARQANNEFCILKGAILRRKKIKNPIGNWKE
jgi:hypothetical protein